MREMACVPCATQPPQSQNRKGGVGVCLPNSSRSRQKGDQTNQVVSL